ncbi:hypothetical protein MUY27_03110 [Mucilaginibacter sp. RS28]|uniref:Uncharacterized protein n=1 Tax=Mucilaginibacter straminoryzae TaxID=2932774 RepID=A0A9X2B7S9_9SPHI|nr:hypothetical protein [Mucilaginibacter straminoryzae]MCJ8208681.1 hypothetical protein [Mucilaginibacter straminoryzae]
MLSTDIYNCYFSVAEESDSIIKYFDQYAKGQAHQQSLLEFKYIHRNIKFIYKKLISVLCNKSLWSNYATDCTNYLYNASVANQTRLSAELTFLTENKESIIAQLGYMLNTSVFETDLNFLQACLNKLRNAHLKFRSKIEGQQYQQQYSIAS